MEDTKELYYYTSSDTMRFILTKGDIFATNLKYMNDGEEYTNGLSELRTVLNEEYKGVAEISEEVFAEALGQQPKIYSISFSRERDLLSQWSMYAKESGISIRMDFSQDNEKTLYEIPLNSSNKKHEVSNAGPHKVYYLTKHVMEKEEYKNTSEAIVTDIRQEKTVVSAALLKDIQDGIDGIWRLLAPYVKRKEFFQEAEYRMTFSLNSLEAGMAGSDSSIRVDYRVQDSVLKPYLDVTRKGGWPVKEIMIGPGFNQETVYDSVKHFLDNSKILVPKYSTEEIRETGLSFLTHLDRINYRSDGKCLNTEWKEMLAEKMKSVEIVQCFNRFVSSRSNEAKAEKNRLKNVYMSQDGIILSISEIPYIY